MTVFFVCPFCCFFLFYFSFIFRAITIAQHALNLSEVNVYISSFQINGDKLKRHSAVIDLGVSFDTKMTFGAHIDKVQSKATAMLGFIMRCSREFRDPYTAKSLHCSLVCSLLKYASVIWAPTYPIHIKRIESIQKKVSVVRTSINVSKRRLEALATLR